MTNIDWKITKKYHTKELSELSFLVTGGAGFIGSNIVQYLLDFGAKKVRVLDNFSNGYRHNISKFTSDSRFELIEGNITDLNTCETAVLGMDYVSHQAALGSVPRSITDPITTHNVNEAGFLNMLLAAKNANVKTFVFASSSSVYGDNNESPKLEEKVGHPLSPYAITKKSNELYAKVFKEVYNFNTIGLRYFNIFGPHQSPDGPYAAVIPLYMNALLKKEAGKIFGDGLQSRDFTFVENAVQANIKAMLCENHEAFGEIFNIACGEKTSVIELYTILKEAAGANFDPLYFPPRPGEIKNSLAVIKKAKDLFGYSPEITIKEGLEITLDWFKNTHFDQKNNS